MRQDCTARMKEVPCTTEVRRLVEVRTIAGRELLLDADAALHLATEILAATEMVLRTTPCGCAGPHVCECDEGPADRVSAALCELYVPPTPKPAHVCTACGDEVGRLDFHEGTGWCHTCTEEMA